MNKYYNLWKNEDGDIAYLDIYGDITSYRYYERDVSSYQIVKELKELTGVSTIYVNINSYGGEVFEGYAIYNALKNHPAKIITIVDGVCASIASIIFMAGEERIMRDLSFLVIHNPWIYVSGNADDLEKEAQNLRALNEVGKKAYLDCVNITDDELQQMLDEETWLSPTEALEKNFATKLNDDVSNKRPSQNIRNSLYQLIKNQKKESYKDEKDIKIKNDDVNKEHQDIKHRNFMSSFFNVIEEEYTDESI